MSQPHPLNTAQTEAVQHGDGPALVIAGAGSGKTRVLTARVATLLERGVKPWAILAFTFTNRAAREMRERIERNVGAQARDVWIGTFHSTAVRLLRREAATLGLPLGFTIYDREDQEKLLREILKDMGLAENSLYRMGSVLGKISDCKNALVTPEQADRAAMGDVDKHLAEAYRRYQSSLRRAGALDFDDLIAESVRMFLEFPEVGARWSERFEHVLVDEYQDTNHAQFRLVQALAAAHGNLFVVGDDDQSIYGWRGADLANILDFERAFTGAVTIRLEQNYRSTGNILAAANAVIANNAARKGKTLWCEREAGALLTFVLAPDEAEEAKRIRRHLESRRAQGRPLMDCAVLYRTNAQSRALETELRHSGMAYEIVGGMSFYQRREVKDLLAHLRLIVNPQDTVAFFRIWNSPRRGLGPVVEAAVHARLASGASSPLEALRSIAREGGLKGAARAGAEQLLALFDELHAHREDRVDLLFARLLEKSGYLTHLEAASDSDFADRRANVEELGVSAATFALDNGGGLLEYLSECSLLTDQDRPKADEDRVLLLTVHNAKGLEFGSVVIAGLEEGLMPHASSLDDASELEEERRLFYVAITRARDEVLLTAATFRRKFDGAWGTQVSRFVDEIPPELVLREEPRYGTGTPIVRPASRFGAGGGASRSGSDDARSGPPRRLSPTSRSTKQWDQGRGQQYDEISELSFDAEDVPGGPSHGVTAPARSASARKAVGQRVHHEKFGYGTILAAEGEGPDMKLEVRFTSAIKKVLARFVTGGGGDEYPA